MKVLMITPRVDEDHDVLGFIVTWVNKLAEKVEKLYVISMDHGKANLRENLELFSLDEKSNKISKILYFNQLMLKILPKVDVIFCHMYPEFTIMAAPFAKIFRKPVVTWYTHGYVSRRLEIAHMLADMIVTASKESFRIKSRKIRVVGHGIDTEKFKPTNNKNSEPIVLSISRISPIKNFETLINSADILVNAEKIVGIKFIIVGNICDTEYYRKLNKMINRFNLGDYFKFIGPISFNDIHIYYRRCKIFVSTSLTGSLDKAVLEAMACEKAVVTCNEAFYAIFDNELREKCWFKPGDYEDLARKIKYFLQNDDERVMKKLREIVVRDHSLDRLTDKLVKSFYKG